MAGRKIRDAADAWVCLAQVARSGTDRTSWAQAHGVDGRSLNAWCLNLGRRAQCSTKSTELRLVELVPERPRGPARYAVHIGSVVVEVDECFEEASLRRLLGVVASC